MNMWSEEFIKNEIDKISNSVRLEIKEKFLNSNREDFKPPETIKLLLSSIEKEEVGFVEYYKSQAKVGYAVNFGTQKILNESFPSAA